MMWHNTLICLSIQIILLGYLSSIKKDHKLPRKSENSKPIQIKIAFIWMPSLGICLELKFLFLITLMLLFTGMNMRNCSSNTYKKFLRLEFKTHPGACLNIEAISSPGSKFKSSWILNENCFHTAYTIK